MNSNQPTSSGSLRRLVLRLLGAPQQCGCVFKLTDQDLPPAARTWGNLWFGKYLEARMELARANKGIRRLRAKLERLSVQKYSPVPSPSRDHAAGGDAGPWTNTETSHCKKCGSCAWMAHGTAGYWYCSQCGAKSSQNVTTEAREK